MVNRVLFLLEKYCDADPAHGPTNSESQLIGAIESTGLVGQIKRFHFDVLTKQMGKDKMGQLLLEDCQMFKPDLVIYTPIQGPLGQHFNPPAEILSQLGVKIHTHLWDTQGDDNHVISQIPYSDTIGIVDSVVGHRFGDDPKIIQSYAAVDPKYFHDKGLERDIGISFVGPLSSPNRTSYVRFLINNGVDVHMAGGQRQARISWEQYSNIMARSKISLNFSRNPYDGTSQMKARALEIMTCGAMLLEEDGEQTKRFFKEEVDFVSFDSPETLLKRVRHYLEHASEREMIARAGHDKATELYNARNCWGYIFEKIGFQVPQGLREDKNYQMHHEKMECL